MKKLLILTNVLWASLFLLSGFKPLKDIKDVASTYHLIDASLVKLMSESYRDNYINTYFKKRSTYEDKTNGVRNSEDSRTIWFSKERLLQFISDMDTEAATHKSTVSGIRFYYIKYPENPNWKTYKYLQQDVPTVYEKRHSLMLVPTYLDSTTQYHTDFDPRRYDTNAKKFKDMPSVMQELIAAESIPITQAQVSYMKEKGVTITDPQTKSTQINIPGLNIASINKAAIVTADDSGDNAGIANGGGLIPPFGVNNNQASVMIKKVGSGAVGQASMANTIDVPCSGATLMLYVDGFKKCGKQEKNIIVTPKN